jgi:hypothetical protein
MVGLVNDWHARIAAGVHRAGAPHPADTASSLLVAIQGGAGLMLSTVGSTSWRPRSTPPSTTQTCTSPDGLGRNEAGQQR